MIPELLTILSAATGVFTGSATCEKMPDGVSAHLGMMVESNQPRVPADSISKSLQKVLEATRTFGLKEPNLTVTESSEGITDSRKSDRDEAKVFYARKGITIRTTSFQEMGSFLDYAAQQGFTSYGQPSFYLDNLDSLQNACLELATRNALERATAAKKALNGRSMSILKITDTERFHLYTSDDTKIGDENIDAFFDREMSSGSGHGMVQRSPVGSSPRLFYKIVPTPRSITSSVKILVKITTAD